MTMLDDGNDLVNRILLHSGEGDWAPYFLNGEQRFAAGRPGALKISLNAPVDADFHGDVLDLFLEYRLVNPVTPAQSDVAFRPCDWTCVADQGNVTGLFTSPIRQASAAVTVEGIQSGPVDITSFLSQPYGVVGTRLPLSLYVGGMDTEGLVIPRGTAASISLSMLYSASAQALSLSGVSADFTVEYQVRAVFQGRKNVRAFK